MMEAENEAVGWGGGGGGGREEVVQGAAGVVCEFVEEGFCFFFGEGTHCM